MVKVKLGWKHEFKKKKVQEKVTYSKIKKKVANQTLFNRSKVHMGQQWKILVVFLYYFFKAIYIDYLIAFAILQYFCICAMLQVYIKINN